ncbi:MAG: helix-turn-helix domain-containing protein [Microgenomates group bacterium]
MNSKNSIIDKVLENFGLTENETKVYLECLHETDLGPFKLAALTGIPRTTVYEILTSLSLKGLVELQQSDGFTKQQTKVRAKNPTTIRDIIRTKKRELSELEVDVVEILPMLNKDYFKDEANADFQFLAGIDGARKVYFSEVADVKLPMLVFDNLMPMNVFGKEDINRDVLRQTERIIKNGGQLKELGVMNEWSRHVLEYQVAMDDKYLEAREQRLLDVVGIEFNQRIVIQGDWIKISCAKEEEAWGIIIRSASLAKTMRGIFNLVWGLAKPITTELVKSWGKNDFWQAEKKRTS